MKKLCAILIMMVMCMMYGCATQEELVEVPDHSNEIGRSKEMIGIEGEEVEWWTMMFPDLPKKYQYYGDEEICGTHGQLTYTWYAKPYIAVEGNEIYDINWSCGKHDSDIIVFEEEQINKIVRSYEALYGDYTKTEEYDDVLKVDMVKYRWTLDNGHTFYVSHSKELNTFTICWMDKKWEQHLNDTSSEARSELTEEESLQLINSVRDLIGELTNDFFDALEYWNENDFNSISDIHKYEKVWSDFYEKANTKYTEFSSSELDVKYEYVGNKIMDYLLPICEGAKELTDLDVNKDGTYTAEEILPLLNSCRETYVENAQAILDAIEKGI